MEAAGLTPAQREALHRRALGLEYLTVGWNVVEAVVAITAGVLAGSVAEHAHAERRALYAVAGTFFLLAAYIGVEAIGALASGGAPERSAAGLVLSLVPLAVMPLLAYWKGRTGRETGSRALQADAIETWVCSYLSLACSPA